VTEKIYNTSQIESLEQPILKFSLILYIQNFMPRKNVSQIQKMTASLISAIGSLIEENLDTKAKTKEL